ncbi:hypothetical protein COCMIDRAFT_105514 [Bipolaris oryzae ATCC 44560]|uniref:Uncharacterized protein n=1 Tax=Bipolaris oryzae ATCC 44560 TaxID=930090 RepID=W6ZDU7_COCMI|nr:uncharacterized protein COCMIDRAFT_105514 [Bipolaris oryzae ATCC 44560]EUC41676.1 hypothetical protein COCMIDRAFT_105514 [Bipolaris oryzae ATCC 44560]
MDLTVDIRPDVKCGYVSASRNAEPECHGRCTKAIPIHPIFQDLDTDAEKVHGRPAYTLVSILIIVRQVSPGATP